MSVFAALRNGAALLAVGNAFYAFALWFVTVATARQFGIVSLGLLALGLALTSPLQSLSNLALRYLFAIEEHAPRDASTYFRLRLAGVLAFLAVVACLVAYEPGEGSEDWLGLLVAVALLRVSESAADICSGAFIRSGRFLSAFVSATLRSIVIIVAFSTSIFFGGGASEALALAAGASALVVVLHDLRVAGRIYDLTGWMRLSKVHSDPGLRALVWLALPLALAHSIVLLQPAIPRYVLEFLQGTEALGAYSALMVFLAIGNLPVTAANQAVLPMLASRLADRQMQEFSTVYFGLLGYCAVLGLVGVSIALVAGEWLMTTVFGREFAPYANLLPLTMIVAAISYVSAAVGTATTATGQYRRLAPVYGLASAVTLVASTILIGTYSLMGAIVAFGLGSLANGVLAFLLFVLWRKQNV